MNDGGTPPGGEAPRENVPPDRIFPGGTYFFIPSSSFTPYLSFSNG